MVVLCGGGGHLGEFWGIDQAYVFGAHKPLASSSSLATVATVALVYIAALEQLITTWYDTVIASSISTIL